ncbi:DUF3397 domain-containing protein [Neobacillus mesonae]|uniref:DUF3397 domain-containing protein n=1 Tax=Neobacillus mesonae TaxID=1193713 RepID=A0A3Q9QU56_9BACI|nr:DUF3397 domain-containing protein [Neobacillus mesonae]AZU61420.1 DUF3397 domain-containing protein [Neobacillus mesonae]MED4202687.1 DUF3397 domain-containing protein [Neobacillus mesonae]
MTSILSNVITLLFSMPMIGFLFIFFIYKLVSKNTRKSVHKALDYTTILFIISVHFLIKTIWGHSLLGMILLFIIMIAMVFVIVHWKVKGEIDFKKVMKGFWRFNFIFFFLAYISLTVFGLIYRAIMFTFSA